jgi:endoglucanase
VFTRVAFNVVDDTSLAQPLASGDFVYKMNLSGLVGGQYYVSISELGRSFPFYVGFPEGQPEKRPGYTVVRGLYHQRCGIALLPNLTNHPREECHKTVQVTDAEPPGFISLSLNGPKQNISGGYHDAGDYDRRQSHTLIPMGLLALYNAYPGGFTDSQFNLPESGNGIPDLLDEAMWGVRLYEQLQEDDGGVRAGTETHRHPDHATTNAALDTLVYKTYRRDFHNTAVSAGLFAMASRLLEPFDAARAATLLARAELAWKWVGAYQGADIKPAQLMYASMELYETTGRDEFHAAFKTHAAAVLSRPGWPQEYRPWHMNIPNLVGGMFNTPYFFTYLMSKRATDVQTAAGLRSVLDAASAAVLNSVESTAYPHGPAPNVAWGSLTSQGKYAEPLIFLNRLVPSDRHNDAIHQLADYTMGMNPLGRSFITGMGARPPTNPLIADAYWARQAG